MSQSSYLDVFEYELWLLAFTRPESGGCPHQSILDALKSLPMSHRLTEIPLDSCECDAAPPPQGGPTRARIKLDSGHSRDILSALNRGYRENTLRLNNELAKIEYLHSEHSNTHGDVIIELSERNMNCVRVLLEGGFSGKEIALNPPPMPDSEDEENSPDRKDAENSGKEMRTSWADTTASSLGRSIRLNTNKKRDAWVQFDSNKDYEMLRWPWECMLELATRPFRSLRRRSITRSDDPIHPPQPPLRVLLISPRSPSGDDAGYKDMFDCILKAAHAAKLIPHRSEQNTPGSTPNVWVYPLSPATVDNLTALSDTGETFEIVHFFGHAARELLYFESETLTTQNDWYRPQHPSEFEVLLSRLGAQLVLLTACHAGTHSDETGRSIAETLILEPSPKHGRSNDKPGIAEVVGMDGALHVDGAMRFSDGFYTELFRQLASPGTPVQVNLALEEGRRRMRGNSSRGSFDIEDSHMPRHYLERPASIIAHPTRWVSVNEPVDTLPEGSGWYYCMHQFTRWWTGNKTPFLIVYSEACDSAKDEACNSAKDFVKRCICRLRKARHAAYFYGSMDIEAYSRSATRVTGNRLISVSNIPLNDPPNVEEMRKAMQSGPTLLIETDTKLDELLGFLSREFSNLSVKGRAVLICNNSSSRNTSAIPEHCSLIRVSSP